MKGESRIFSSFTGRESDHPKKVQTDPTVSYGLVSFDLSEGYGTILSIVWSNKWDSQNVAQLIFLFRRPLFEINRYLWRFSPIFSLNRIKNLLVSTFVFND